MDVANTVGGIVRQAGAACSSITYKGTVVERSDIALTTWNQIVSWIHGIYSLAAVDRIAIVVISRICARASGRWFISSIAWRSFSSSRRRSGGREAIRSGWRSVAVCRCCNVHGISGRRVGCIITIYFCIDSNLRYSTDHCLSTASVW